MNCTTNVANGNANYFKEKSGLKIDNELKKSSQKIEKADYKTQKSHLVLQQDGFND